MEWQRIGEVSQEIKRVRAQMEENEELAILMRGLRGQNLRDSQFAADDVQLRLVEVYDCIYCFNSICLSYLNHTVCSYSILRLFRLSMFLMFMKKS